MIERFRGLSPPFRYLAYATGALLVLSVALGVGAAAAVVVGWQSGAATTGSTKSASTETGAPAAGKSETAGTTQASEDTASEPSSGSESPGTKREVSFVHRATDENSRGDHTVISDPSIDGRPNATVLVSLASGQGDSGATAYDHNIGVWYAPVAQKWAIFNQDRAPVPAGTNFEVKVPQPSTRIVHEAGLLNTAGNYTYLDNELTNGKPDAALSVTQNWNPGGGRGVYNNHPVGTVYDATVEKWAVYNRDGAAMPEGAAFNIAVSAGAGETAR